MAIGPASTGPPYPYLIAAAFTVSCIRYRNGLQRVGAQSCALN